MRLRLCVCSGRLSALRSTSTASFYAATLPSAALRVLSDDYTTTPSVSFGEITASIPSYTCILVLTCIVFVAIKGELTLLLFFGNSVGKVSKLCMLLLLALAP